MALSDFAKTTIERLQLQQHPEGGYYRRDWQHTTAIDTQQNTVHINEKTLSEYSTSTRRPLASMIYFLLPAGENSAWHRVDAEEIWLWHGPGALTIEYNTDPHFNPEDHNSTTDTSATATITTILGAPDKGYQNSHLLIPAHAWQRTIPSQDDVLVTCIVTPGFVYQGFTLENQ